MSSFEELSWQLVLALLRSLLLLRLKECLPRPQAPPHTPAARPPPPQAPHPVRLQPPRRLSSPLPSRSAIR